MRGVRGHVRGMRRVRGMNKLWREMSRELGMVVRVVRLYGLWGNKDGRMKGRRRGIWGWWRRKMRLR